MDTINLVRGDTKVIDFYAREKNGAIYDLTNHTMTYYMKKNKAIESDTILFEKDTVVASPTTGVGVLSFTTDNTKGFTADTYDFELKIYTASKNIQKTVAKGVVNMSDVLIETIV